MIEPTTLHSFALSVLMRNPGMTNLPEPLRVPDKWETKTLLNPDLSIRLKAVGHSDATPTLVAKLTNEMAAGWDRLDPGHVLLSDVDPSLRNAYRAAWMAQRTVFGYSLFAEMPFTARELIQDHPNLDMGDVAFLVVDEYQDLNRCDIGLVEAVAETGVAVLAVGDDDQSIYSFRGAAPHGIRQFREPATYPALAANSRDYTLSTSFRCGENILSAARDLIESSPGRPTRPSLRPGPDNPPGVLRYLRFTDQAAERSGVVRLINYLV